MKRKITQVVYKGFLLAALSQTVAADGVKYQVTWDEPNQRYNVYLLPDETPTIDRTLSAQVTLRMKSGTFPESFTDTSIGLTGMHSGALWNASSRAFSPVENPDFDYVSFTPTITDPATFKLKAEEKQEIFNFSTDGKCLGIIEIINNDTDPFMPPNSLSHNIGNEFTSLLWAGENNFKGIIGSGADCRETVSNTNPVANDDTIDLEEDGLVNIDVLANDTDGDGDKLTISSHTDARSGAVVLIGSSTINYKPDSGFFGEDSFTYTVSDGKGGTATGTVSVNVTKKLVINNNPVLGADVALVPAGGSVEIDVLSNDTDPDGDPLTITEVGTASGGVTSIQNQKILYVSDGIFSGSDSFSYTVSDTQGGVTTGLVKVNVSNITDNDGDGLSNDDEAKLKTDPDSSDSDGDGVSDKDEVGANILTPLDTDQDGTINALDTDDDNDTILSRYEGYSNGQLTDTDSDRDGKPDYLDADDDNDGLITSQESPDGNGDGNPDDALDSDRNGTPDYLQVPGNFAPGSQVSIPTLSQWGVALLSILLSLIAIGGYLKNNQLEFKYKKLRSKM